MKFYIGLHQPSDAKHFERCFVSVNRIRGRRKPVESAEWIMDSGAFTEISTYGEYRHDVDVYAQEINRQAALSPGLIAAVSQDYMCEDFILKKTGMTVRVHQRLAVARYDRLCRRVASTYVMPVLQGYAPDEYVRHLNDYGVRLAPGAYVGVGSVCKRNSSVTQVEAVLLGIKAVRPDLRIHGFGLKLTALKSKVVQDCLASSDSVAWSYAARMEGRNQNDWREAAAYVARVQDALGGARATPAS